MDPTEEPVTLREARQWLELGDSSDHDDKLLGMIQSAREQVEHDTGLAVMTQTWVQRLDRPPDNTRWQQNDRILLDDLLFNIPGGGINRWIELQRRPVQSLTSITYIDVGGTSQTMSSSEYELDVNRVQPVVWLAYNESWPPTRGIQNALTLTYVAGYTSREDVPWSLKQALLLLVYNSFYGRGGLCGGDLHAYERLVHQFRRPGYP